ncbi:LytR/AlgR family response regulator transcription factor [Dyadobacter frigoris]|uniref:Response regulator transcription factor n=1 Tax=Dyadobacter frigoris TaxID=2576211 RepID=A0A4U6CTS0_9BACT|nr:LytTR family DNA-binding domain-containing protein [Dyadobacter frigoris]TKT88080.1 response regulator transcription factor [Dyadobacter frigoris]GLU53690.1 DNA-binding response regulator [Dyadobacter frigoris]
MKCLIVDDNIIARTTLKQLVKQNPELILAGECADAMEAYRTITSMPVDLLLLDIEMKGMSGIELVKSLGEKHPIIIFTTSKKDYAAEAFELHVADYITKPVTTVRFLQAIEKAWEIHKSKKQIIKKDEDSFIFIRDSNIVRRLKLDEILFAEAMGDYVKLYTSEKFYSVHSSLKEVESKLPESKFLRVHRSFIIQVGKIDTIEGGTLIINRKMIPVADTYRAALNQRLKIL